MFEVKRVSTKYGNRIAFVVTDGVHRPKMFFDKDLVCALLGINYKEYWRLTRSDDNVNIEYNQKI